MEPGQIHVETDSPAHFTHFLPITMFYLFLLFTTVAGNPLFGGGMMAGGSFDSGNPFGGAMNSGMRPSFLQATNSTVIQEWDSIFQSNKTIAQQQQDQLTFGSKYGLTIQVQQWQQNMTTFQNEMSQNLSAIISALSPLKEQFMNILNNKDQTPQALLQSIMQLKNQSGANGDALFALAMIMMKNSHQNGMQTTMGGAGSFGNGWNSGEMGGNSPFSMGGGGSGFPTVQMPQNINTPFPGTGQTGSFGNFGGGFPSQGQNAIGYPQNLGQQQLSQPLMFAPGPMIPFQGK